MIKDPAYISFLRRPSVSLKGCSETALTRLASKQRPSAGTVYAESEPWASSDAWRPLHTSGAADRHSGALSAALGRFLYGVVVAAV